uniref:Uncharacterized protein n=1 Tax=viral metagenome TaxID=1070528 RepID=A0A6H1ZBD5_9ZZZZ
MGVGAIGIGMGMNYGFGGRPQSPKTILPDGDTSVILLHDLDDPRCTVDVGLDLVWNQATGATVHATQAVAANQPALGVGGLGGHRYATFDGATKWMNLTGLADASHDLTFFAVLTDNDAAGGPNERLLMSWTNYGGLQLTNPVNSMVGVMEDSSAANRIVPKLTDPTRGQCLTWRIDDLASYEVFRDGKLIGSAVPATTQTITGTVRLGASNWAETNFASVDLYYLVVVNRACTDAETAAINAWLMARFNLVVSPLSVANCCGWWDLDHATQAGGILTALTDRALAGAINIYGSPTIVSVGGQDFVLFDGINDALAIADAAALDGALGYSHVLKHASFAALPANVTLAQKGRSAVHLNGGIGGHGSAGARFTAVCNSGNDANVGPLAEFTSPAETIAMAIESGVAVRRIDGDGTYASTATAQTTTVGAGSLTWGARETGAGTFDEYSNYAARAGASFARPINRYELEAVRSILEAT